MGEEVNEEAGDIIRFYVWSGYYRQDEVLDIATDETEEANENRLRDAIDKEFCDKRELERLWPPVTDCDRLDGVFKSLSMRGILTRHRCGMTIQDGIKVIELLYNDAFDKQNLIGYCFYHLQDMEAVMWGGEGLWLAFSGFPPTRVQATQVGEIICEEFKRSEFTVQWDGNPDLRLLLKGFRWQRRSPL
jgi:hypothetical protein